MIWMISNPVKSLLRARETRTTHAVKTEQHCQKSQSRRVSNNTTTEKLKHSTKIYSSWKLKRERFKYC